MFLFTNLCHEKAVDPSNILGICTTTVVVFGIRSFAGGLPKIGHPPLRILLNYLPDITKHVGMPLALCRAREHANFLRHWNGDRVLLLGFCQEARQDYSSKMTNSLTPRLSPFRASCQTISHILSLLRAAWSSRQLRVGFSLSYGMVISLNFYSKLSKSLSLHDSFMHLFTGNLMMKICKSVCPHYKNSLYSNIKPTILEWRLSDRFPPAGLNFRSKMSES